MFCTGFLFVLAKCVVGALMAAKHCTGGGVIHE